VLFIPFMLVYSIPPTATILWLPVIILVLILVTAGPTYLGALFGLYFPDLKGVAQNLIRATFFLSAALIPLELIPGDTLPLLIQANPLTGIFEAFRAVIVFQSPPQAAHVLYPAAFGVVALAIGLALYRSRQAEFAKAL
jgi:homopolymeric O-antigen transport system permease protein